MKKFLLSGIVGTFVYYLLGILVYTFLFPDKSTGDESLLFIFFGCLFYSFLIAYFCIAAHVSSFKSGFYAGIIIGILYSLTWYFFLNTEFDLKNFIEELVIGGLMTAILAAVIGYVNGKIKSN